MSQEPKVSEGKEIKKIRSRFTADKKDRAPVDENHPLLSKLRSGSGAPLYPKDD